jgi:hypothetical protein
MALNVPLFYISSQEKEKESKRERKKIWKNKAL